MSSGADDAEEEDVCRICRCEASDSSPLHSPCLCNGSVALVHVGCLEQWLKTSGRVRCELCKYTYRWREALLVGAPKSLPARTLIWAAGRDCLRATPYVFESLAVIAVWLFFLICAAHMTRFWLNTPVLSFSLIFSRLTEMRLVVLDISVGAVAVAAVAASIAGWLCLSSVSAYAALAWHIRRMLVRETVGVRRATIDAEDTIIADAARDEGIALAKRWRDKFAGFHRRFFPKKEKKTEKNGRNTVIPVAMARRTGSLRPPLSPPLSPPSPLPSPSPPPSSLPRSLLQPSILSCFLSSLEWAHEMAIVLTFSFVNQSLSLELLSAVLSFLVIILADFLARSKEASRDISHLDKVTERMRKRLRGLLSVRANFNARAARLYASYVLLIIASVIIPACVFFIAPYVCLLSSMRPTNICKRLSQGLLDFENAQSQNQRDYFYISPLLSGLHTFQFGVLFTSLLSLFDIFILSKVPPTPSPTLLPSVNAAGVAGPMPELETLLKSDEVTGLGGDSDTDDDVDDTAQALSLQYYFGGGSQLIAALAEGGDGVRIVPPAVEQPPPLPPPVVVAGPFNRDQNLGLGRRRARRRHGGGGGGVVEGGEPIEVGAGVWGGGGGVKSRDNYPFLPHLLLLLMLMMKLMSHG